MGRTSRTKSTGAPMATGSASRRDINASWAGMHFIFCSSPDLTASTHGCRSWRVRDDFAKANGLAEHQEVQGSLGFSDHGIRAFDRHAADLSGGLGPVKGDPQRIPLARRQVQRLARERFDFFGGLSL